MVDDDPRDERDERVQALLEVQPLDEATRQRLVSTAMDATQPSRTIRWVAVAAAVVVVAVIGFAVLSRSGDTDHQAATSAPNQAALGTPSAGSGAIGPGSAGDSAEVPNPGPTTTSGSSTSPIDVGDFGNLDDPANLARLRAALRVPVTSPTGDRAKDTAEALASSHCAGSLPTGTVTAVATGTLDGRSAIVVLTTTVGDERSIDAVLTDPCEVHPLS
jgi:hypothetical protein